ncbi:MAG TPA: DUF2238 domain-containing protein [Aromatoleum sp.]|uniref:DUF2238 domain-containing protein n=1 Tax=Aromatoleum sp. TaxID=2307007 RepID=UPI002B461A5E|nr:DUF2238 domain-containing protein [Aromatoleum sp.]HJV25914.1 DUF2238 domain-containing protein [Aromatoleum sp.]
MSDTNKSYRSRYLLIALGVLLTLLALSGIGTYDFATWVMEVFPIFIVVPVLCATYRRFPLTNLLYVCIFLHALVLMVGGHYTYARVPIGFEVAEAFGLHRNPYDKLGHFFQGFVPALAAREILIRGAFVNGRRMLNFLVVCVVLAISASYEFIEWGAGLAMEQGADEFLGTQGDPWDTQSDMFMALVGAVVAVAGFARLQDREIAMLPRQRQ